ncbi:MmgE/PrpD family protein [Immundisolibacter sp.]|uniref:MmgE/PrpD family protein n=1 Tax=Immundisolibacter sp. TaxID=1934948 RepID=UPI002639DB36|nr:MmgE/PrpD family protein [Immundisolibacter sp.]MDD3650190.1 MmgE/PrpD family protein [Immundisolibacter sp.]
MIEPSLTERLADWQLARRAGGFAAADLEAARLLVLDWLGAALAGLGTDTGRIFLDYARLQPAGRVSLLGLAEGRSVEVAALVNGALSHIVEMDDVERASVTHPGAVVVPAALAVAERVGAAGRDFLAAVVAGYEVMVRVGAALGPEHYHHFHNTSTAGVFGAAAAAGWLLDLDRNRLVWALGNAGTQAAGLWQFNEEGALTKPLHPGRAAANGVLAATLSRLGLTGARQILEGERGFFAGLAPRGTPLRVVEHLGEPGAALRVHAISIKPHASCRHTHAPIDAALALRAQIGAVDTIAAVQVDTYQAALTLCDKPDPRSAPDAKFSLQYCVAMALLRGRVGLAEFEPDALADPAVRDLLTRVTVGMDAAREAAYPATWSAGVSVQLRDGRRLAAAQDRPKGDPENPLSPQELEAKFRQLAAYGGLDALRTDQALAWLRGLPAAAQLDGEPLRSPAAPSAATVQ